MQNLEQDIRGIVAEIIEKDPKEITKDAEFVRDLGVDSMTGIEIFSAIDKKYNLDVPEEKLKSVKTVGDLVQLVNNLI